MNKPVDFDASCRRRHWLARQRHEFRFDCRGFVQRVFVCLPTVIDTSVRHFDRALGRSYNGLWQRLFLEGHSLVPLLFMLTAILFDVALEGTRLEAGFNGEPVIRFDTGTSLAGFIGLWTTPDSTTWFDQLVVDTGGNRRTVEF